MKKENKQENNFNNIFCYQIYEKHFNMKSVQN
jgi:hypothetical protein